MFVGEQMQRDQTIHIRYEHFPIHTTTRDGKQRQFKPLKRRGVIVKAGGGAMLRAAEKLGHEIADMLRSKR